MKGALIGCGFFAQNQMHGWAGIRGVEIVAGVTRLCAMNLFLNGIGPAAWDGRLSTTRVEKLGLAGRAMGATILNPRRRAAPNGCGERRGSRRSSRDGAACS